MSLTPHGPGFSFIDAIELVADDPPRLRATKFLDPALPFFADHFPQKPIMPGVLIIEMAAQTAGALLGRLSASADSPKVAFSLVQVVDFRLRHPARPGDTLVCEVEMEREFGSLAHFGATVRLAGRDEVVAQGKIILACPPR
jgi:3-hydroxyacyl-[acyl-carrier-protein] dehydratase